MNNKPLPKSQVEISQNTIEPYLDNGKGPVPSNKRRENQRTRDNDDVKDFSVSLQDIDKTIVYYFDNIIKPSVIQNGIKIPVPFIYGSPERWKSVQADGYYRDKDGKIQTPLIMFKRNSVERNRTLGNKMDANNPLHYGIFEKKYSQKNIYDQFSTLSNRTPIKEYYGVIIPDYVDITYTCVIFTEYVNQMNKIVESINFASDAYWGDLNSFKFRASIDSYTTAVELSDGQDRTVRTTFDIKMAGYIINDQINASVAAPRKMFSKAEIKFKMETAGSSEEISRRAITPESTAPTRFYDSPSGGSTTTGGTGSGMTAEQIAYVGLQKSILADSNSMQPLVATFTTTIANTPTGFPALTESDFQVFINGIAIPPVNRTTTTATATTVIVTFNNLDFNLDSTDQVLLVGKLS
jgi:hypothetical protein